MVISEENINPDPFRQFGIWYRERFNKVSVYPDSVSLATSSGDGKVSVRTVLLKEFSETGFVFFTNYNSRKGQNLHENPNAAMLFYWPESGQQVRIEGKVQKISPEESDLYFAGRPRESQLGAWASSQSVVIPDRNFLEQNFKEYENLYISKPVPRPPHWGGFRLIPDSFEFWQEGEFRLHDRIFYSRKSSSWNIARLSP
jgi:pyridoxamine 5'-phosphate oxidase